MKRELLALSTCLTIAAGMVGYAFAQFVSTDIIKGVTDGIHYATGGISKEERMAMNKLNKNYNLRLIFALKSGHYLSDLQIDIQNTKGKHWVFKESHGPLFLVNLPEGKYRVTATHKTDTIVKDLNVSQDFQTVMFHWHNLRL